jgi:hypothetical protein
MIINFRYIPKKDESISIPKRRIGMLRFNLKKAAAVAAVCLSLCAFTNVQAAWVPQTQLEQFYVGGQWKDSTSDTNAYDSKGLVSSVISAVNIGVYGLVDNTILATDYDAEREPVQQLLRSFDKAQGVWADTVAGTKWTRLKDANKRDTAYETQNWNPVSKKWFKSAKVRTHYNGYGYIDTLANAVWDTTGGVGAWVNTVRTSFAYNTGNKVVLTTMDTWLKGDLRWLKQTKLASVYDGQNLVVSDTAAVWDSTNSSYLYTTLHLYSYNAAGLDTGTITLTYSKSIADFLNSLRSSYTYNAGGHQTLWVQYRWTKNALGNGIWLQTDRETDTYNAGSQVLATTREDYDSAGAKWDKLTQEEWVYDGNSNPQSETFSSWDTTVAPHAFVAYRKLNWTYIQVTTVGSIVPLANLNNAAKASFRANAWGITVSGVNGMTVSVFDMNGRQVRSLSTDKNRSMLTWNYTNASGLRVSTGNYIMKVSAPGLISMRQIKVFR